MPSPRRKKDPHKVYLTLAPHEAARIAALAPRKALSDFVYDAVLARIYALCRQNDVITNITGVQAPGLEEAENAAPPYWGEKG